MFNKNHLTEEQIALAADAINSHSYDELPEFIREHLAICDQCSNEVMMVTEIAEELESETAGVKKKAKILNIKPWHLTTISIAAAIALLFVIIQFTDIALNKVSIPDIVQIEQGQPEAIIDKTDSVEPIKHEETFVAEELDDTKTEKDVLDELLIEDMQGKLLAVYEPDETLEQLYHNMKGAYRSINIKISTPHEIFLQENDSLRWRNPENIKLYIELFNNLGEEVKVITTEEEGIAIPDLDKGLYYWKLISESFDLLFVGKIIVE